METMSVLREFNLSPQRFVIGVSNTDRGRILSLNVEAIGPHSRSQFCIAVHEIAEGDAVWTGLIAGQSSDDELQSCVDYLVNYAGLFVKAYPDRLSFPTSKKAWKFAENVMSRSLMTSDR
jgi:hypothetical protein